MCGSEYGVLAAAMLTSPFLRLPKEVGIAFTQKVPQEVFDAIRRKLAEDLFEITMGMTRTEWLLKKEVGNGQDQSRLF